MGYAEAAAISLLMIIAIFMFWQVYTEAKILEAIKNGKKRFPDERYFELKSKIQYIVVIFSLVTFTVGLFGYTTIEKVRFDLTKQLRDSINYDITVRQRIIATYDSVIEDQSKTHEKFVTQSNKALQEVYKIRNDNYGKPKQTRRISNQARESILL